MASPTNILRGMAWANVTHTTLVMNHSARTRRIRCQGVNGVTSTGAMLMAQHATWPTAPARTTRTARWCSHMCRVATSTRSTSGTTNLRRLALHHLRPHPRHLRRRFHLLPRHHRLPRLQASRHHRRSIPPPAKSSTGVGRCLVSKSASLHRHHVAARRTTARHRPSSAPSRPRPRPAHLQLTWPCLAARSTATVIAHRTHRQPPVGTRRANAQTAPNTTRRKTATCRGTW